MPPPRPANPTRASRLPKDDAIGRLLRGDAKAQPQGTGSKTTSASVLAAQRALQKLGYDLTLDGHMGSATRQALDKFEHQHHLARGGEVTPKLLRELAGSAEPPHG